MSIIYNRGRGSKHSERSSSSSSSNKKLSWLQDCEERTGQKEGEGKTIVAYYKTQSICSSRITGRSTCECSARNSCSSSSLQAPPPMDRKRGANSSLKLSIRKKKNRGGKSGETIPRTQFQNLIPSVTSGTVDFRPLPPLYIKL